MKQHIILLAIGCAVITTSAWSIPFYPGARAPIRVTRFAPQSPLQGIQIREANPSEPQWLPKQPQRPKRDHDDYGIDHGHRPTGGVTGPVHTFVKTDKNANYKWGVRHHVGNKYAS